VRFIAIVSGAVLALSLPFAAQAGEGCSHAKSAATSASADDTFPGDTHATCAEACPHSAQAAEGTCGCNHAATAADAKQDDGSTAATHVPAASDAIAVTQ
jgi:hypothetical protein